MPQTIERFTSGTVPIAAEIFSPPGTARHPGCLILHGTFGLLAEYRSDILSFAEALADAGVVALLPHYFERTATTPGVTAGQAIGQHLPEWMETCSDALIFLQNYPRVDSGRLGAIGFSLGGHIALSLAMAPPAGATFKCVVEFFGPTLVPRLLGDRATLPPVQIHHGTADPLVPFHDSEQLVTELRAAGKVEHLGYEFLKYPAQSHGFKGSDLITARFKSITFVKAAL